MVIAGSVHWAQAAHLVVHPHLLSQLSVLLAHQAPQQPVAVASAGYSHVTDCASLTEISTKTKSSSRRLETGKRIPMRRGGWVGVERGRFFRQARHRLIAECCGLAARV